jgi:hypothetical protein
VESAADRAPAIGWQRTVPRSTRGAAFALKRGAAPIFGPRGGILPVFVTPRAGGFVCFLLAAGDTSAPFVAAVGTDIAVKVIDERGNELPVIRRLGA